MANGLYAKGKMHMGKGDVSWKSGGSTIKVTLLWTAYYTVDLTTHEYMNTDTIPTSARVATGTLILIDPTTNVFDAENTTVASVSGSSAFQAYVLWKDGGGGGTSSSGTTDLLLAYIDTATGLPLTPDGSDITIKWDDSATKRVFAL